MPTLTPFNMGVDYIGNGVIYIHRNDELTIQKIVDDEIIVIDASTAAQGIPNNVNQYVVEEIDIIILKDDNRYTPYRFSYVNNNGGTDYINFSLAEREKLKIKKDYLENDNSQILYNTDVEQEFTVFSESMTEDESKNLRYFWISPKIELIRDGVHYPVNIKTKSAPILRDKESGLIFYNVTFRYEANFNVQK
jgi:hypothetical protein